MASILIAGGAGYIGSHMTWQLIEAGHHIVILDDLSTGNRDVLPMHIPFIQGSIADKEVLSYIFQKYNIDIVFHFAAYIDVGESVGNPAKYYQNNVAATLTLLDSMCTHNIKSILFSSSAAVYGEPEYTPVDIHHPTNPVNAYGRTKLMVEQILKDYDAAYGLRSISFRYFNASGADPQARTGELHRQESHLIPIVLQVAAGKRSHIEIYGTDYPTPDGTCIRYFVHVSDICSAHFTALQWLREGGSSKTYNIGSGTGFSVKHVIDTSKHITCSPIPTIISPRRPGDPAVLVANSNQIHKDFGWKPQFAELTQILTHAWNWERRNNHPQQRRIT